MDSSPSAEDPYYPPDDLAETMRHTFREMVNFLRSEAGCGCRMVLGDAALVTETIINDRSRSLPQPLRLATTLPAWRSLDARAEDQRANLRERFHNRYVLFK